MTKRVLSIHLAIALAVVLAPCCIRAGQIDDSKRVMNWVGEIMDSQCATEGTHDKMAGKTGAKNAQECTVICAKNGSFVLYDADTKTVYQLDDQQKPMRFAGQRVRISGTYDVPSKTITIQSIEAASKGGANPRAVASRRATQ